MAFLGAVTDKFKSEWQASHADLTLQARVLGFSRGLKWFFYISSIANFLSAAGLQLIQGEASWLAQVLSVVFAFSLSGTLAGYILLAYIAIAEDWLLGNNFVLVGSFGARDRRGRRTPAGSLWRRVAAFGDGREMLRNQPDAFLFALLASESDAARRRAVEEALALAGAAELAAHIKDCRLGVVTILDFTQSRDARIRRAAVATLPPTLWRRAVETLAGSAYPEPRRAALNYPNLGRDRVLGMCRNDPAEDVRGAAWEALGPATLSEKERLLSSTFADTRLRVVNDGATRRQLIRCCLSDKSQEVRALAWDKLRETPVPAETDDLSHSLYADIRLSALRTGELSRRRKIKLCQDKEQEVRAAAWFMVKDELGYWSMSRLRRSRYQDVRLALAEHETTPVRVLKKLAKDKDNEVRTKAFLRLRRNISESELRKAAASRDAALRRGVAKHPGTPRKMLRQLLDDYDLNVRASALERFMRKPSPEELRELSGSQHPDVLIAVARHRGTPTETLRKLRAIRHTKVATAALEELLWSALPLEELQEIARTKQYETQMALVKHPRTPRAILALLVESTITDTRVQAAARMLRDATPEEIELFSKSQDAATRLAVAGHAGAGRAVLCALASDRDDKVRHAAWLRVSENATPDELKSLLASDNIAAKRAAMIRMGEMREGGEAAPVFEQMATEQLRGCAVEAVLDIEGDAAIPKIIQAVGLAEAFRLTPVTRLVSFMAGEFARAEAAEVVERLSTLEKRTQSILAGTTTYEEDNYDPYSYSTTTQTRPEHCYVSYYSLIVIARTIDILKRLDDRKREEVLRLLQTSNAELASLLDKGLYDGGWKYDIYRSVLRTVAAIGTSGFSAAEDESITAQLE